MMLPNYPVTYRDVVPATRTALDLVLESSVDMMYIAANRDWLRAGGVTTDAPFAHFRDVPHVLVWRWK